MSLKILSLNPKFLVRDSLEFEIKSVITDDNGRYILLNAIVQGSDYILGNIYAPNKIKEQCNFFDELQQKFDDFITIQDQRIIIGGDLNVIMDQNLDCALVAHLRKRNQ